MKYCTKCGTQMPINQNSCNVCGSLAFCSVQKNPNETLVKTGIYYIGNTQVTPEQIKQIEELIISKQKLKAVTLVKYISGLSPSDAVKYVDNYFTSTEKSLSDDITNTSKDIEDIPIPMLEDIIVRIVFLFVAILLTITFFNMSVNLLGLICFTVVIYFIFSCISSFSNYRLAKNDFDQYRYNKIEKIKRKKLFRKKLKNINAYLCPIIIGVILILIGLFIQVPGGALTTYESYNGEPADNYVFDDTYSSIDEYVGGDAYNFIIGASLVAGKISGTMTTKAIFVVGGTLCLCVGITLILSSKENN